MTTDPTDAAAQILEDYEGPSRANTRIAAEVVVAWLHASVACLQCQGTGSLKSGHVGLREQCPGPHTRITVDYPPTPAGTTGHHSTLYADPDCVDRIANSILSSVEPPYSIILPLPPGWTVT